MKISAAEKKKTQGYEMVKSKTRWVTRTLLRNLRLLRKVKRLRSNQKKLCKQSSRVVIKSRGPGISPGYQGCGLRLLLLENRRKIEQIEIPSWLIPCLLNCIYPATWNLNDNPDWDFKIHYKWFHDFEIEQKLFKTFCFLHINMTTSENEITTEHTFFFIPEEEEEEDHTIIIIIVIVTKQ